MLASRIGWRITPRFVQSFCGRVLGNPSTLFDEELLRPELQDRAVFADGIDNIVQAMSAAAISYFSDGSIERAVPPLQALLHIMCDGTWQGHDAASPAFRQLFTRESVVASDWYQARLAAQQRRDVAHWQRQTQYLEKVVARPNYADVVTKLGLRERLATVRFAAGTARAADYPTSLVGTLGVDPALAP